MNTTERYTTRSAVYLLLVDKQNILLSKRKNTGYMDGFYSLVSGHVEANESIIQAMIRETKEEIGITIVQEDLTSATTIHRQSDMPYYDFYFVCHKWLGTPVIAEPEYCSEIIWTNLNKLPTKLVPYIKEAISNYHNGVAFSVYGWE